VYTFRRSEAIGFRVARIALATVAIAVVSLVVIVLLTTMQA
jgi:hypothetical protein